jgi:hypothetical protein
MNETIKQHWVALGPRNYGKSIEWKLEGDPWDTEGLYSDQGRDLPIVKHYSSIKNYCFVTCVNSALCS